MRKLIHSDFSLNLSNLKLSESEENSLFSDTFFKKTAFPFEVDLTNELDTALYFISRFNTNYRTFLDCKIVGNNKIENCTFEVQSIKGYKLSCVIEFGYEQLPNWDKLLSELPLEVFDLPEGTTIYEHANAIISQTYPAVNYNFPQIHTDKYKDADYPWGAFTHIVNNRVNGEFLVNDITIDGALDVYYENNRTIIQPFVYCLYLLKKIIEDAGYTLSGEIIDDVKLKNRPVFSSKDYFKDLIDFSYTILIEASEYTIVPVEQPGGQIVNFKVFSKTITLENGFYSISGLAFDNYDPDFTGRVTIKYNGQVILQKIYGELNEPAPLFIDTFITANLGAGNILEVSGSSLINAPYSDDSKTVDLVIKKISDLDENLNPLPSIVNEHKINLKKSVPEMTCGEFITQIKNWFNYDLYPDGDTIYMNKIVNLVKQDLSAKSLQQFEEKEPIREFQTGISFLHKFTDIESKDYVYKKVFQNINGVFTEDYKEDSKTNPIEVNALPLPQVNRSGVETAFALEDDTTKLYLVHYDGLVNGNNYTKINTDIHLENIHAEYWEKWFANRINTTKFKWNFFAFQEQLFDLEIKRQIYGYKNYHIISTMNKTEISQDLYQVEIESEMIRE